MARLTKSQLLSPKTKEVTIADWGGEIVIRALSGRERQELHAYMLSEEGKAAPLTGQAMAVWYAAVDPTFENEEQVLDLSGAGIGEAFRAIMEHSGLVDPDEAKGN